MYVCICNALRDREVKAAAEQPETGTVADVFRACGARPKYGKCLQMVADMIDDARDETGLAVAAE